MRYYPIYLDIRNRHCLVVGGGDVGTRKVLTLLECGGRVTVVSPEATKRLQTLAISKRLTWKQRGYQASDVDGMFMVFGATNNEALNQRIHQDAERMGKLCNIADRPEVCNFILPAIVSRGDLTLAISTSGKSPAFAKQLKKDLENQFGPEYEQFLVLMGNIRKRLLATEHAPEAHKPLFEKIIHAGLVDLIRQRDYPAIDRLLTTTFGEQYTYQALMAKP